MLLFHPTSSLQSMLTVTVYSKMLYIQVENSVMYVLLHWRVARNLLVKPCVELHL